LVGIFPWTSVRIALLAIAALATPVLAAVTTVDVGGGTRVRLPLTSVKALRDENVVKQGFDYSCGAAALATLLTYALQDPLTEVDILRQVLASLSGEGDAALKKKGLSLLDLQHVAEARGYRAQGFRLAPTYLDKLQGPVIVFFKPRGYEHFAVLKGVVGDRVYLADPSLGNVRLPLYEFLSSWLDERGQGIIFVVQGTDGSGAQAFLPGVPEPGSPRPELLGARHLLEIGNPNVSFLHPSP
jgi:hypothetical protein